MENEKGENSGGDVGVAGDKTERTASQEESEALKKCLAENKGDHNKCKSKLEAFNLSSSSPPSSPKRKLGPLRLRRGSLTDV